MNLLRLELDSDGADRELLDLVDHGRLLSPAVGGEPREEARRDVAAARECPRRHQNTPARS